MEPSPLGRASCYISPPSFLPSPTSAMPSPIPPTPSAPQTMTLMTSNTLSSTLPPIYMAALPSSDPIVSPLPGDTLLYGQHGPSSIAVYIPQHHYPLPSWPVDGILDQPGTDTDMTDASYHTPEATWPNTPSDIDTEPMPITPSSALPFDPPNSVIPEK